MIFKNFLNISKKINLSIPKNYMYQIYLVYAGLIFTAILEMLSLGTIPIFITLLLDAESSFSLMNINLSLLVRDIFGNKILILFPIFIILLFIIKNILMFLIILLETSVLRNLKIFFIKSLFNIYLTKPYEFYLRKNSSEIVRNIFNETQYATSLVKNLIKFFREFTIAIVITILILVYDPVISFSVISIFILFFLGINFLFNNYILNIGKLRLKFLDLVFKGINTLSGAIKDIKIYQKEKYFRKKFSDNVDSYEEVIYKQSLIERLPRIIYEILTVATVFATIAIFIYIGGDQSKLIPLLALFAVSLIRMLPAFTSMSSALYYIKYIKISFEHITNQIIENKDKLKTKDTIFRSFYKLKDKIISINNLDFNYQTNSNIKSITNINFEIKKGDFIGIIGKSGSGKSTLINLILGLLKQNNGKVDFNSDYQNLKDLISYVPQDIYLLDDTIKRNIAFGEEDNEIDDKKVEEVIISSGLSELIKKNKKGLELILGERGIRLSGGEKQRVGIARALYRKPKILILDEATSSLDTSTEKDIINSINYLKNKLTIIIVTHRLNTIKNCEKVFLIKDGKIIDSGNLSYLTDKYSEEF